LLHTSTEEFLYGHCLAQVVGGMYVVAV